MRYTLCVQVTTSVYWETKTAFGGATRYVMQLSWRHVPKSNVKTDDMRVELCTGTLKICILLHKSYDIMAVKCIKSWATVANYKSGKHKWQHDCVQKFLKSQMQLNL